MKFIGRTKELKRINDVIYKDGVHNLLIYGRRRIGKSFLIKKALENYNGIVIHYQCKNINIQETVRELSELLTSQFKLPYLIKFNSFDDILKFLYTNNNDIVFVIDEYSYLINKIEGLNSIIQYYIDMYKDSSNLKLILSGSQIDIMKSMSTYDNPLYGRFDDIIELKEHDYLESSLYYPNFSNEDKLMLYSVFGGEPLYNSMIDDNKTVIENILELMVKENSIVELNISNLMNLELSKINYCNDVLIAIAGGVKKNDDLVTKAHINSSSLLNPVLTKLLKLDLIKKVTPINDLKNKKKTMYLINNNALRFYYKYIYKFENQRSNLDLKQFFDEYIKKDFEESLIPNIFEDVTRQYLVLKNKRKEIVPSFSLIGTYWYDNSKSKTNGQFDVVTYEPLGYIFYEVKYTNSLIDERVVSEEKTQLQKANINYYNLGFVSKTGFTNISKEYHLITLNDIYNIN